MLTPERMRQLARYVGRPVVTTVCLDVDGRRYPRQSDLDAEFAHLTRLARLRAQSLGVERAVEADLARIAARLREGFDRVTTRGVVAISCSAQDFLDVIELPRSVPAKVGIGPHPRLRELAETLDVSERTLVVLVDGRRCRFFRWQLGRLTSVGQMVGAVLRGVDLVLGPVRDARRREEAVRRHLRHVAEVTRRETEAWPADHLLIGGPEEPATELEALLPTHVRRLVRRRIPLSFTIGDESLRETILAVEQDVERGERAALVEQLRQRAARDKGGVVALEPTLDALAEGRVDTLVVERGFEAWGARCGSCGWRGPGVRLCPVCHGRTDEVDDIVEVAVEEAITQGARVVVCDDSELDRFGHIGAIERF